MKKDNFSLAKCKLFDLNFFNSNYYFFRVELILCSKLFFSFQFRFGNKNVESCFHRGLIQNFYSNIVRFLLENCVIVPDVFRKAGNIAKLNGMEPAIDKGDMSFLDLNRCVDVVAPIFKRFLVSFYESIIPIEIADAMRLTPGKKIQQIKTIPSIES